MRERFLYCFQRFHVVCRLSFIAESTCTPTELWKSWKRGFENSLFSFHMCVCVSLYFIIWMKHWPKFYSSAPNALRNSIGLMWQTKSCLKFIKVERKRNRKGKYYSKWKLKLNKFDSFFFLSFIQRTKRNSTMDLLRQKQILSVVLVLFYGS